MSMVKCHECGSQVSSEAAACPSCGAKPKPAEEGMSTTRKVILLGLLGAVFVSVWSEQQKQANPSPQKVAAPAPPPKSRLMTMMDQPIKESLESLKSNLLAYCQLASPRYNHISVKVRGDGIYCVHDFYNEYSFSAGSLGRGMGQLTEEWTPVLRRHKLNRMGVWGEGQYATGVSYEIDAPTKKK